MTVINKQAYCMYNMRPTLHINHKDAYQSHWLDDMHEAKEVYYYIEVMNTDTFSFFDINELVPKDIMQCIIDGDVILAIANDGHGYHGIVEDVYVNVLLKCKIDPKQLLLMSESSDLFLEIQAVAKKYNMECCGCIWTTLYERTMVRCYRPHLITLEQKPYNKKFLSLNGMRRPHRDAIVFLLSALNLIDQGYVSYNSIIDKSNIDPKNTLETLLNTLGAQNEYIHTLLTDNKEKLLQLEKLHIDDIDVISKEVAYQFWSGADHLYENTYFSVVTETNFPLYAIDFNTYYQGHTEVGKMLSEKTFKPIIFKHPFIVVSNPRILELIRSLGYKTFSPWIDESYDLIDDDAARLLAIVYEVKRLCELDEHQLSIFLANVSEICEFNKTLMMSKSKYKHTR